LFAIAAVTFCLGLEPPFTTRFATEYLLTGKFNVTGPPVGGEALQAEAGEFDAQRPISADPTYAGPRASYRLT